MDGHGVRPPVQRRMLTRRATRGRIFAGAIQPLGDRRPRMRGQNLVNPGQRFGPECLVASWKLQIPLGRGREGVRVVFDWRRTVHRHVFIRAGSIHQKAGLGHLSLALGVAIHVDINVGTLGSIVRTETRRRSPIFEHVLVSVSFRRATHDGNEIRGACIWCWGVKVGI